VIGPGREAKIKIAQGKRKKKKIRAPRKFEKKICAVFNREYYKLK
jgi:hypothetical protein